MKKYLKPILIFLVLVIGFASFIIYGLYLLAIEDAYGDLQQIYFDAKTGDLVVNNLNGEVGILEIGNTRMFVNVKSQKLDVREWWESKDKYNYNVDVYRLENSKRYSQLSKSEFRKKIESEKIRSISHVEVKY